MTDYLEFLCGREWEYTNLGSNYFKCPSQYQSNSVEFSVMSYNILAQKLLEDNRKELYGSVDDRSLDWNHRRYRLLLELRFLNPQIVCMQEVQRDHLNDDLIHVFESMGYYVIYQCRTGDKTDGCLIMFKKKSFKLLIERKVTFYREGAPTLDRDNVGLVVLLSPIGYPELKLCVSTTHLLFNPRRGDIKLSQLVLLLAEINSVIDQSQPNNNSSPINKNFVPCILCGDFNSIPYSPLYNFITQKSLDYTKFSGPQISGQPYQSKSRFVNFLTAPLLPRTLSITGSCRYAPSADQCLTMPSILKHEMDFNSVYDHISLKYPGAHEVTSYHDKSEETLDYIFYTKNAAICDQQNGNGKRKAAFSSNTGGLHLSPLCRLGLLTGNEMKSRGGLPNRLQCSDHLPLFASFLLSNKRYHIN